MKKLNNYRMLVSDLDGTLLSDNKKISKENLSAIKQLVNKGVTVVLCSGRIFSGVKTYANQLGIDGYVICCGGADIRKIPENSFLYSNYIAIEDSLKIVEVCKKFNIYIHAYIDDKLITEELIYSSLFYFQKNNELSDEEKIQIEVVPNLAEYILKNSLMTAKFVIMSEDEKLLSTVRVELSRMKTINISSSLFNNIEITNAGVDKAKALGVLCNHLNITIEQTVAIGDNENDLSLIKAAGFGVAMGNAIAEMKETAGFVTDTNENSGVAKAIGRLFLR